jgi:hypothetical protein
MYIKSYNSFLNENFFSYSVYQSFSFLDLEILENGNLKIILNDDGKEEVDNNSINENNFSDYFDDIQGNTGYRYFYDASVIGFMTEAPIIINQWDFDDKGDIVLTEDSIIWTYNNYAIKDFTKELVEQGYVIFSKDKPFTENEIERFKKEKYKIELNKKIKKYNI